MIIRRLTLDSFAGLAGRELEFVPGLNVVLGPNEAGKSTSFHAIQKVLLMPARLSKRQFESEMMSFVPINGDTARAGLGFEHRGESYSLSKSWGGTSAAELRLPGGSLISDDAAISERMSSLLPAKGATLQTVLMTYQSGLEDTLTDLHDNKEAVHTLSDLLRKTVMEPDGVPVEDFRDAVEQQREGYYSNWDEQTGGPMKGRGINNPWIKSVGSILAAYYEKERAAQKQEQALAYEAELDRLNGMISQLVTEIAEREAFIRMNEKVAEDARQRGTLDARQARLELSTQRMSDANSAWPVLVSEIRRLDDELPGLQERLVRLREEKKLAERAEVGRELRDRFARVLKKKEALDTAARELDQIRRLTTAELAEIRQAAEALNIAATGLSAGKLAASLHARGTMKLRVTLDLGAASERVIDENEELSLSAGGRIHIDHPDWSLQITSGEIDFSLMQKNHGDAESALAGLLQKYEAGSLEEAVKVSGVYEEAAGRLGAARQNLEEDLGDDDFETLAASVRQLEAAGVSRPLTEVAEELFKTEHQIELNEVERAEKRGLVDGYKKEYGSLAELLLRVGREVSSLDEIDKALAKLAPLPDGFESAEEFIRSFETAKQLREAARSRKGDLEVERAELHGPDETSEELATALGEAAARFEATLRRGEAISRIASLTETILTESAGDIYEELERDLERYVATITDNRYTDVAMEDGLPLGFERQDGAVVLHDLLSHGTRDVLGLALRLSMAGHFLKEREGFLAMDDPMVNLDPERQQKAAAIIREYADRKQVIVFTCHPAHAGMLGGNLIRM